MRLKQTGIFRGRVRVRYGYARWGLTRGGGKTWHGGIDLEGLDDTIICMPYFTDAGATQNPINIGDISMPELIVCGRRS